MDRLPRVRFSDLILLVAKYYSHLIDEEIAKIPEREEEDESEDFEW